MNVDCVTNEQAKIFHKTQTTVWAVVIKTVDTDTSDQAVIFTGF